MKPGKAGVPGKDVQSVFDVVRHALTSSPDDPKPNQRKTMQKKRPEDDDEKRKRDG